MSGVQNGAPQGLKPACFVAFDGTAEAVPFQNHRDIVSQNHPGFSLSKPSRQSLSMTWTGCPSKTIWG